MRQINQHFTFEFAGQRRLYLTQLGRLSVLFTSYEKALRKRAMLDLLRKEKSGWKLYRKTSFVSFVALFIHYAPCFLKNFVIGDYLPKWAEERISPNRRRPQRALLIIFQLVGKLRRSWSDIDFETNWILGTVGNEGYDETWGRDIRTRMLQELLVKT